MFSPKVEKEENSDAYNAETDAEDSDDAYDADTDIDEDNLKGTVLLIEILLINDFACERQNFKILLKEQKI